MSYGSKIRKIRLDNKLTQDQFAELIFVSRSTLAQYEISLKKPNIETLNIICSKFNVNLDEFRNEINNTFKKKKTLLCYIATMVIFLLTLVSCKAISINEHYGYNIYDDELKVKNSEEICIVQVVETFSKNKISKVKILIDIKQLSDNCSRQYIIYNHSNIKMKQNK